MAWILTDSARHPGYPGVLLPRLGSFSLLVGCALFTVGACGDYAGTDPPPPPALLPVASVTVSPGALALTPGQAGTLTAALRDASGAELSGRTISWTSSDQGIATVSVQGLVTGAGVGSTTVSATAEGKTGSAQVTVAHPPATTVVLAPLTLSLQAGQVGQFVAEARDPAGNGIPGKTFSWVSSNPLVATVSPTGQVTAVILGAVTISASVDGKTGNGTLTVVPGPVATVAVTPPASTLQVGQNVQLNASANDAQGNPVTGRPVTWTSANPPAASVSTSGLVSALVPGGPVTVTATVDGQAGAASVTVVPVPVASVQVTPTAATVVVNGTMQLTATAMNTTGGVLTGRPVQWVSANPTVATVNAAGLVTGVTAGGPVTATATIEGKTDGAAITVALVPVATVQVSPPTGTVGVGLTTQLTAATNDVLGNALTGRPITWQSGNPSVATVSIGGLVTGLAPGGPVSVTATAEGHTGSASVTVVPGPVPTLLFEEKFENASFASRGWYDILPNVVTTAEHIPASLSSLEGHFNQGATNTSPGIGMRHKFAPSESVYLSYWVKYSSNWVGSGQNFHPHEFYFMTNENPNDYQGPAFTRLTTTVEQNYQSGLGGSRAVLSAQDGENIDQGQWNVDLSNTTENRAVSGCNGPAGSTRDGTPNPDCYLNGSLRWNGKSWRTAQAVFTNAAGAGYKNDWHKVEAYFKLNSIVNGKAQLDGIVRYWFDGQLVIDRTNVELRTGARPTMKFDKFLFSPYIGNGSPVAQSMWVDDLVVMDGKP